MTRIQKPSIDELVKALQIVTKFEATLFRGGELKHNDTWLKAKAILDKNAEALKKTRIEDIDKENLARVIDQILANGIDHFNMCTFLGSIYQEDKEYMLEESGELDISKMIPSVFKTSGLLGKSTKTFNCDSVGCIAGFATAIALNWDDKRISGMDNKINTYRGFEHIACNYLNIPLGVGECIFFGEGGSIWSFLKAEVGNDFNHLQWDESSEFEIETEGISEEDWPGLTIELNSINYKTAASALSMILEGELSFLKSNAGWYPVLTNKFYSSKL